LLDPPGVYIDAQEEFMTDRLEQFRLYREKMNEKILGEKHQQINRFFALDTRTYEPGALDARTKEMLGLATSMVLRCDDCISYHVIQCKKEGVTRPEFFEIFNVALVVGGSIVIPHLRRAVELLDELEKE
jgi:AhpD family alkylhydroperoxidase